MSISCDSSFCIKDIFIRENIVDYKKELSQQSFMQNEESFDLDIEKKIKNTEIK
jgi:hypothetical protein